MGDTNLTKSENSVDESLFEEGDCFKEISSSNESSLFRCELSWSVIKWPFLEGFEERLAKALEVYEDFFIHGREDFNGYEKENLTSLFLHVSLVDDEQMRELNHTHRNKDKTTDVLSFPLFESLRNGITDDEFIFEEVEFGDIIISVPVMEKQAEEFKVSLEGEFFHLLTHGFLHLLGYDHELSDEEEALMEGHEKFIIDEIYSSIGIK